MKKLIMMLGAMLVIIGLAGCAVESNQSKVTENTEQNGQVVEEESTSVNEEPSSEDVVQSEEESTIDNGVNLEQLIAEVYENSGIELFPSLETVPLTKENQAYMLGVDNFDFVQGFVSEPMMSSQAHSMVIFEVDASSNIDKIKEDIAANVDPNKWICVGVSADKVVVDGVDNIVILIMDEESEALHKSFLEIMSNK